MHPLIRDLYKRAIVVGRDYPLGLEYVRNTWKKALQDPNNSTFENIKDTKLQEKELRKAVGRGRYAIREMIGVIQLKKYRTMRRRYGGGLLDVDGETKRILNACSDLRRQ